MEQLNLLVKKEEKESLKEIAQKELGSNNMTGAVKFLIRMYNKK